MTLAWLSVLEIRTMCAREERARSAQRQTIDLHSLRMVDFFNLFPHVGALVVWGEPNDAGVPEGLLTRCTGTLIDERVLLTAGHCVAWAAGGLPPSVMFSVTFSPDARDRSTWRDVAGYIAHPSLPPCPPPDLCTFRGLDPGILDIGLVFLSEPVRHITPARLAQPDTLKAPRTVESSLMVLPGYGDLDSAPGGRPQPVSDWDGWRRIKISTFAGVVADEWASWSVPGVVCFGDSGSPTFLYDRSRRRADDRVVAVASDGGDVCFSRDDRARVDTAIARDWVRRTIAQRPCKNCGR